MKDLEIFPKIRYNKMKRLGAKETWMRRIGWLMCVGLLLHLGAGSSCGLFGPKPDCRGDQDCFSADYACLNGRCLLKGASERTNVDGGPPADKGTPCQTGERRSCYTGPPGARGIGICQPGEQLCVGGNWGSCVGDLKPSTEVCNNGFDDDCDATVDENCGVCEPGKTRTCYNGPQGTALKGLCKEGSQTCREDKTWSNCLGQVLPREERCDGEDDDCDARIDENCFECREGEQQGCYPENTSGCEKIGSSAFSCKGICKVGSQSCSRQGRWGPCEGSTIPKPEQCNGLDENCDGINDNGVVGPSCPNQQGACSGSTQRCGGTSGWLPCDERSYREASADYQPGRELGCDGKDNNCDGLIDENCTNCMAGQTQPCYSGPAGTQGKAPCKAGTRACQADGKWGACKGQVLPQTESCDGKDNDCDARIDESSPNIGRFCNTSKPGVCSLGSFACRSGVETCEPLEMGYPEICNNKDDDCDGKTDENTQGNTFYRDADGDGYGDPKKTVKACLPPAGYVRDKRDCYDANKDVFPGQFSFFTKHRGDGSFDYNCDGNQQKRYTQAGSCKGCQSPLFDQGFVGGIPSCGTNGKWIDRCFFDVGKCSEITVNKLQECR